MPGVASARRPRSAPQVIAAGVLCRILAVGADLASPRVSDNISGGRIFAVQAKVQAGFRPAARGQFVLLINLHWSCVCAMPVMHAA